MSLNGITRSILPLESIITILTRTKTCAHLGIPTASSCVPNTGSTSRPSHDFQPFRNGLISITVGVCVFYQTRLNVRLNTSHIWKGRCAGEFPQTPGNRKAALTILTDRFAVLLLLPAASSASRYARISFGVFDSRRGRNSLQHKYLEPGNSWNYVVSERSQKKSTDFR